MNILYNNFEHNLFGFFMASLLKFGNIKFLTFLIEKIY